MLQMFQAARLFLLAAVALAAPFYSAARADDEAPPAPKFYRNADGTVEQRVEKVESELAQLKARVAELEKTCKAPTAAAAPKARPDCGCENCPLDAAAGYASVYARVSAGERVNAVAIPGKPGLYDCWKDASGRQVCLPSAPQASVFNHNGLGGTCSGPACSTSSTNSCPGGVCPQARGRRK